MEKVYNLYREKIVMTPVFAVKSGMYPHMISWVMVWLV
jgi:hypothetical protein